VTWTRVESDVPWDPGYLELVPPERVFTLDELGEGARTDAALSPLGITTPFRILSDEGARIAQRICAELSPFATGDHRISRRVRSGMYQSEFLRGLAADEEVAELLRSLAQAPLELNPISHQAVHINFAPEDLSRHVVDDWHVDTSVSFDYVMMVSDPRPMQGGRFEYFTGSAAEGLEIVRRDGDLPLERVVQPAFPGPGWAVLMQGHLVLHRAHRLEAPYPRISLITSYYTPLASKPIPEDASGPLYDSDPHDVALAEWSRYTAVAAARRLQQFAETTDVTSTPEKMAEGLRACIAGPLDAIEQLEAEARERV